MLIGHKKQQTRLQALCKKENIPHAMLFSGPEGVGKRTVAWWFFKTLNCSLSNDFCGECSDCKEIERGVHPDISQIKAQEKEIQMDQIADAVKMLSYKGIKAKVKGVVIDDAHLMNVYAQNALLKTLEEPFGNTLIVLVTSKPHLLLPTILSRVVEMKFSYVSTKEIDAFIKDQKIAELSFGCPGKAIEYKNNEERQKNLLKMEEEIKKMKQNSLAERFSFVKETAKEEKIDDFISCLIKVMRENLICAIKKGEETERVRDVIKEAEKVSLLHAKTNINIQLALEKIAIKI